MSKDKLNELLKNKEDIEKEIELEKEKIRLEGKKNISISTEEFLNICTDTYNKFCGLYKKDIDKIIDFGIVISLVWDKVCKEYKVEKENKDDK